MEAEDVVAKMSGLLPGQEVYIEWSVIVVADVDGTFTVVDYACGVSGLSADEAATLAAEWVNANRDIDVRSAQMADRYAPGGAA